MFVDETNFPAPDADAEISHYNRDFLPQCRRSGLWTRLPPTIGLHPLTANNGPDISCVNVLGRVSMFPTINLSGNIQLRGVTIKAATEMCLI